MGSQDTVPCTSVPNAQRVAYLSVSTCKKCYVPTVPVHVIRGTTAQGVCQAAGALAPKSAPKGARADRTTNGGESCGVRREVRFLLTEPEPIAPALWCMRRRPIKDLFMRMSFSHGTKTPHPQPPRGPYPQSMMELSI